MNMIPMTIVTACHLWTCAGCIRQGDYPHALMWACYGLSTVALMWYEIRKIN